MFKHQLVRYKVIYDRKKTSKLKGKAVVQIEAYQNGNRRYFSTGIHLTPVEWNVKKNEPKDPFTFSRIRDIIRTLEDHEKHHRYYNGGNFALSDFDSLATKKDQETTTVEKLTLNQFYKEELDARRKELTYGTFKNQNACLNTLNEFNPVIGFDQLDYNLIKEFHWFLINKGQKHFTYHKRHVQLNTYIKRAIKSKLTSYNPYDDFRIPTPVSDKVALLPEEIILLEKLTFKKPGSRLERIRDMFLFSVYTGLRWGDVSQLTRRNLIETKNGITLNVEAEKTEKTLVLPLHLMFDNKAEDIVRKHWPTNEKDKLFHGVKNHLVNLKLKVLAEMAGIKKNLHFHISRHTAGTTIAKKAGVLTAQRILQHSKLETTKGYLHLSNDERDKSLNEVKDWY